VALAWRCGEKQRHNGVAVSVRGETWESAE